MVREIKGIEGIIEGVSYAWDRGMAWHSCEVAGFWASVHWNALERLGRDITPSLFSRQEGGMGMRAVVRWRNVMSWDPPCRRKSGGGCEHEAVASGRKRGKGWGTGPCDFPLTTMLQPGL